MFHTSPIIAAEDDAVFSSSSNLNGNYTMSDFCTIYRCDGPATAISTAFTTSTISTTAIFGPPNNDGTYAAKITYHTFTTILVKFKL